MARPIAALALLLFLLLPAAAQAAAPPNDDRGSAQTLNPPATVRGTTVGATNEATEPGSCQGVTQGSVWYQVPSTSTARALVLELDAAGDMDAAIDVYRRDRSQLRPVDCGRTNSKGRATIDFDQSKGAVLLIRVAPLANSSSDAFTLRLVSPDKPERPPGAALPRAGASGSVDRIANPDDAYATRMTAGTTYRVHLVSKQRCANAKLYPPGTSSFADDFPVRSVHCDKYFLYTPGPGKGGRYSIVVSAPRNVRGKLPYHVQVAPATDDDTSPGVPLPNDVRMHGSLRAAGTDVLDLYRFDVAKPSILDLQLKTGDSHAFNLELLTERGRHLECECGDFGDESARLKLKPGRYFAVVRARGASGGGYVLSRLTRTITATSVLVDGERHASATPGRTVNVVVGVTPGASGPVTMDVQRFDPLAGWQFYTRFKRTASGGSASIAFTPPSVGRWRFIATFDGTRRAAPSGPARATLLVADPLTG